MLPLLCGAEASRGAGASSPACPPLPEGSQGIAAKYPGDLGIEADPAVIFHDDFESDDLRKKWSNCFQLNEIRITEDPANVHGGKKALEFTVPQQKTELSNGVVKEFSGHDIVFLRYYSKFEKGFDQTGSSHNGGMLAARSPGLAYSTPGIPADGRNKFNVSLEDWRSDDGATPSPGGLNVYVYHPEQRGGYGDHFFPSGKPGTDTSCPADFGPNFVPRPNIIPELGRWYCFELMVKTNTPGQRDGRIAYWLDGRLVGDFPDLRLRDVDSLKINFAELSLHIRHNTVRENKKWYDDVVVATSYVGPVSPKE